MSNIESCPKQPTGTVLSVGRIDTTTDTPQALSGPISTKMPPLVFGYTNWRGEYAVRRAIPLQAYHGTNDWHPEPQWLMEAFDMDNEAVRVFAMKDMVITPWRDITTAPLDGSQMRVGWPGGSCNAKFDTPMHWNDEDPPPPCWVDDFGEPLNPQPTAWWPYPPPPAGVAKAGIPADKKGSTP